MEAARYSPDAYVEAMVEIYRSVLQPRGSLR
jgi:hypothetical protein